jgi:hypothetical protein
MPCRVDAARPARRGRADGEAAAPGRNSHHGAAAGARPGAVARGWGGIGGEKLWHWLRGEDFGDPELEHQKSIGHSHVLSPELRTPEGAYAVANKLLHKAAMRLRKARLWASHMTLTIRFAVASAAASSKHSSGIHQQPWAQSCPLLECQDNQTLVEGLQRLWSQSPAGRASKNRFSWAFPWATWFPTTCTRSASSPALKKRETDAAVNHHGSGELQVRDQHLVLCQHAAGGCGGSHAHRLFQHSGSVLSLAP